MICYLWCMYYAFVKMYQFIKLAELGIKFCTFKTDENETKTQVNKVCSHFVLLCFSVLTLAIWGVQKWYFSHDGPTHSKRSTKEQVLTILYLYKQLRRIKSGFS